MEQYESEPLDGVGMDRAQALRGMIAYRVWLLLGLCLPCLWLSCRRAPQPGSEELPPGIVRLPGVFEDVAPRWSHDGKRIAFLRRTTDRRYQLFVAPADLSRVEPLSEPNLIRPDLPLPTGRANYRPTLSIDWSPDDQQIAMPRVEWFEMASGEQLPGSGLWVCSLRTRRCKPVAVHPKDYEEDFYFYRSPQWSPDGKRLAFMGESIHGETALFVRPLGIAKPEVEVPRYDRYADTDWPAWSPNGKRLAFRQGIQRALTANRVETVRIISPGTPQTARQAVFHAPLRDGPAEERRATGLVWSPDGTKVALALTTEARTPECYSLWVIDAVGNAPPRRVSPADGHGYLAPVWIDDQTLGALRPAGSMYEVVAIPLRGDHVHLLCRLPGDDMDWSPDRKRIVCAVPQGNLAGRRTTLKVFATGL